MTAITNRALRVSDDSKLFGRGTAATGILEEITLGTNLYFYNSTLNASNSSGSVGLIGSWARNASDKNVFSGTNIFHADYDTFVLTADRHYYYEIVGALYDFTNNNEESFYIAFEQTAGAAIIENFLEITAGINGATFDEGAFARRFVYANINDTNEWYPVKSSAGAPANASNILVRGWIKTGNTTATLIFKVGGSSFSVSAVTWKSSFIQFTDMGSSTLNFYGPGLVG